MPELADFVRRNTTLLLNALDELPPGAESTRASERTNSIEFLVLHLVDSRFYLVGFAGLDLPNTWAERYADARGIDDIDRYPPMSEMVARWTDVGDALTAHLEAMPAGELDATVDAPFPLSGPTRRDGLLFLLGHEMYHIGQIAMLRKQVGLPGMAWE